MVTIGQKAPDFIAPAATGPEARMVELFAEIREVEVVVLLFYPADFVPTCTAELLAVRDAGWHDHPECRVFGLSGDSLFSHAAYADRYALPFPLVSDFHGGIADSYNLLEPEWEGHHDIPGRATVVIDDDWSVAAIERADPLETDSPAPVERAHTTLVECTHSLEQPVVDYGRTI